MPFFGFSRKSKRRKSAPDVIPQASQSRPSLRQHRRHFGSLPVQLFPHSPYPLDQLQQPSAQLSLSQPYPYYYPPTQPAIASAAGATGVSDTTLLNTSHACPPYQQQWERPVQAVPPIPTALPQQQSLYHMGTSASQPHLPVTANAPSLQHFNEQQQLPQDSKTKSMWKSTTNLLQLAPPKLMASDLAASADHLQQKTSAYFKEGAALCDLIASKLDAIVTSIDGDLFSGEEKDLVIHVNNALSRPGQPLLHSESNSRQQLKATRAVGLPDSNTGTNYFSKVWLYSNSRLPPYLPPFKVYMPTYPLLCLAARYSDRVYNRPTGPEREAHIDADWRSGAKAMVLKSVPIDDMNTIIFAIRGSQTFMDWTVNFRPAPSSPTGFLEDSGNLCHSGFLMVARAMVSPVASRLRALLNENPSRANRSCSLVITGHSAGGAVAALLYSHMMTAFSSSADQNIHSELTAMAAQFKRVHCITFGAPPVSLLPLQTPVAARHKKSMFFAFINEGDPVPRADKAVVTSLLKLYAAPPPGSPVHTLTHSSAVLNSPVTLPLLGKYKRTEDNGKYTANHTAGRKEVQGRGNNLNGKPVKWHVPPSTLSNAGRLVLLREHSHNSASNIAAASRTGRASCTSRLEASIVTDEQLRSVVFGDPVMHMMGVYAQRIETLATRAVTVKDH